MEGTVNEVHELKRKVKTMGLLQKKKSEHTNSKAHKTLVCPICVTDEERQTAEPDKVITEDAIHDDNPIFCARCKKKIK